jgi:Arc/MetJ family transcription regulator
VPRDADEGGHGLRDGGLTYAYRRGILICMRTTLNIDDEILSQAAKLTGVQEKTRLVRMGLEALIARESAARLAALGGTEKKLRHIRRRRSPTRDSR